MPSPRPRAGPKTTLAGSTGLLRPTPFPDRSSSSFSPPHPGMPGRHTPQPLEPSMSDYKPNPILEPPAIALHREVTHLRFENAKLREQVTRLEQAVVAARADLDEERLLVRESDRIIADLEVMYREVLAEVKKLNEAKAAEAKQEGCSMAKKWPRI